MSFFDDNEDRTTYGKRPAWATFDVTCKRCGKDGLRWQDEDGEWVLMEGQYKVHHCDPKVLRAASLDGFHAL